MAYAGVLCVVLVQWCILPDLQQWPAKCCAEQWSWWPGCQPWHTQRQKGVCFQRQQAWRLSSSIVGR